VKTGDIVRYADPEAGEEALLFIVLEAFEDAQPPRVTVRLVDDNFSIAPISTYSPKDLEIVDNLDTRLVQNSTHPNKK
jgi:hypothetical protein